MIDQVRFHEFMTAELLSQAGLHQKDTTWVTPTIDTTDGVFADLEAQDYDTFEEWKI